jgi:hypothetical protein
LSAILVLSLLAILWATMGGHTYSSDEETYLLGTRALLHHTTVITPSPDIDGTVSLVAHKNGMLTTAAPIGTLVLFAPGLVVGKIISLPFGGDSREEALRLVYLSSNSLMTALTAGLLFLLSRRLGASRRVGLLLSIAFALGTWAWPHSKTGFSEPGTSLMLTSTMLALVAHWQRPTRWSPFWVGLLAGCVVLTRASTMLFLPIFALMCLVGMRTSEGVRHDARRAVRTLGLFAAGGVLPAIAFSVNAWLRFGSLVDSGYQTVPYTTPPAEGLFGLFLSPGKGLVWYAPIVVVVLFGLRFSWNAQRRYALTVGLIVAAHLFVYARFEVWSGEAAYGPRYLLPLLPLIVALAAPVIGLGRQWWRGALIATAIGVAVPGVLGGSMFFNAVYVAQRPYVSSEVGETAPRRDELRVAYFYYPRTSQMGLYFRSVPLLVESVWERVSGRDDGIKWLPREYEQRVAWYQSAIAPDYWWAWWARRGDNPVGYSLMLVPVALVLAAKRVAVRGRADASADAVNA